MKKHGLCGTPLYNVWLTMKQRCYNPKDKHYKWAEKLNITPSTLRSRINKGWTIDRALTTPVRRLNRL